MTYLVNKLKQCLTCRGTGRVHINPFTRYVSNPILAKGANGTWEDGDVANPDVKWDVLTNQWVMNYSGFDGAQWHTGLAYSPDLLNWTKEATNPVFSPNLSEGYIAANGSIITIGSTYYLYYQSQESGQPAHIFCATSPDLLNWTRANGGSPVIDVGAGGQWDDYQVFDPYARTWPDGTVEIIYAGDDGSGHRGIGRATSTNGIAFTKHGKLFGPDTGELDINLGTPVPVGNRNEYCIYHDSSLVNGYRYTSRAWTEDAGATFTRERAVLTHGGVGQWDSAQVFDSSPVYYNGILYLFYAGGTIAGAAENLNANIGLATTPWTFRRLIS